MRASADFTPEQVGVLREQAVAVLSELDDAERNRAQRVAEAEAEAAAAAARADRRKAAEADLRAALVEAQGAFRAMVAALERAERAHELAVESGAPRVIINVRMAISRAITAGLIRLGGSTSYGRLRLLPWGAPQQDLDIDWTKHLTGETHAQS